MQAQSTNLDRAATVNVYLRGGGVEPNSGFNSDIQSYALQPDSHTTLVRTSSTSYERRFDDGSKEVFAQPDGASTYPRKVFLTQVVDARGNGMAFTYDSSLRLVAVTDSLGQVTTLSYDLAADPLKITKVTDPFGRFAKFDYNHVGQLAQITDVVGIISQFAYGASDFITTLTTPYGDTTFTYGDIGNGGATGTTRWLEAVDPMGGHERVEYRDSAPGIADTDPTPPTGMSLFNTALIWRNSFYWDKKAMQEAPGNYNAARLTHWFHATDINVTSGVVESEKQPLENRLWRNYPGQPNLYTVGTLSSPSAVGRVLDDGTTQLYQYQYNAQGKITKAVDPSIPARVTTYQYDTNGIDLLAVYQQNPQGSSLDPFGVAADLVAAYYTYNSQHEPLTSTDASGQTTHYTYYLQGQIWTITNAKNETTTFNYTNGYLTNITGPVPGATRSFAYDDYGRVQTVTDSEGYKITTDYDALNRVTKVTYPDTTYEQVTYNILDVEWTRDRLERMLVLQNVNKIERRERVRTSVMKQLDANPELKEAYRKLVQNLPADQQEKAMTSIAARTLRTITPRQQQQSKGTRV